MVSQVTINMDEIKAFKCWSVTAFEQIDFFFGLKINFSFKSCKFLILKLLPLNQLTL